MIQPVDTILALVLLSVLISFGSSRLPMLIRVLACAVCRTDLHVVDGDLTESEIEALRALTDYRRPILLVLNKCDRYTVAQREELRASLLARLDRIIQPENLVEVSADPAPRIYIEVDAEGRETETERASPPDVTVLKERIWEILEAEGKTLAALNASLFAADLSDQVGRRIDDTDQPGQRVQQGKTQRANQQNSHTPE